MHQSSTRRNGGAMQRLVWVTLLAIVGCAAANPGVAALVIQDKPLVTRQAATGFSDASRLKVEALREAIQHCQAHGGEMRVVSATESQAPYLLGSYPRAEVRLKC